MKNPSECLQLVEINTDLELSERNKLTASVTSIAEKGSETAQKHSNNKGA